jgi:hypothetical protein
MLSPNKILSAWKLGKTDTFENAQDKILPPS